MHAHIVTAVFSTLPSGKKMSRYGHGALVKHERSYYPHAIDSRPHAVISICNRTGELPWGTTQRSRGECVRLELEAMAERANERMARQEHVWHRTEGS